MFPWNIRNWGKLTKHQSKSHKSKICLFNTKSRQNKILKQQPVQIQPQEGLKPKDQFSIKHVFTQKYVHKNEVSSCIILEIHELCVSDQTMKMCITSVSAIITNFTNTIHYIYQLSQETSQHQFRCYLLGLQMITTYLSMQKISESWKCECQSVVCSAFRYWPPRVLHKTGNLFVE